MDWDILFVGKLFPKEIETEIKSKMKTGMQEAANALQWNIINGLDANNCGKIQILDYLPIDSYPNGYTDKYIKEYAFQHTDKYRSDDKVVGCTNITIIKQFVNVIPLKKEVNIWLQRSNLRKKIVIIYTASSMFLELCKYVKKIDNDIITCCIIADIPEFLSARKLRGIEKAFNYYETQKSALLYKYIDKYVLLTEHMSQKLSITAPYIVMEGIATDINIPYDKTLANRYAYEKCIIYTGTLNYQFGIMNLLTAFSKINSPNIKLIICGYGQAEEMILKKQKEDNRIIFLGKLDREKTLSLQKAATVLVNPRQNNEEFTKYSFPSKTMEYLVSGVPVVAYKLDGIPDEYDEYLNYVEENTPEALAKKLIQICDMSQQERTEMGRRGREFVLNNKNAVVQTQKILELIKG